MQGGVGTARGEDAGCPGLGGDEGGTQPHVHVPPTLVAPCGAVPAPPAPAAGPGALPAARWPPAQAGGCRQWVLPLLLLFTEMGICMMKITWDGF